MLFTATQMQSLLKYLTPMPLLLALLIFTCTSHQDVVVADIGCGGTGIVIGGATG
jgi:hypothetical protein